MALLFITQEVERCIMGVFDIFRSSKQRREEFVQEKFWSLTTADHEVVDPKMKQIQTAVKNATSLESTFATLTYNHSGLEVESIQAVSDDSNYRFEAIASDGKIYVNDGLNYEEIVALFKHFFMYREVSGFKNWPIGK